MGDIATKVKPVGQAAIVAATAALVAFAAIVITLTLVNTGFQITQNGSYTQQPTLQNAPSHR